ncbi:unnamed protein product [Phytophthora lilii]|uniref:Unnamed protein product n=1 Tax=Phytophthora lilii TaxID=2077276 RepID=A0A9W6UAS6_9STRA|nr:unnamed protein product [Phytophthora lilii]
MQSSSLEKRFDNHKRNYKRWREGKVKCAAMIYHHFLEHGIDNSSIHLVSEHEIPDRKNLLQFEQLFINSTNCVNKQAAWKSEKDKHADKLKYNKYYNKIHNQEIVECACGETYTRGHRVRHEQTERHRFGVASEEERKNMDDAREEADYERKQALKARRNAPVECECGTSYPKAGKSHHVRKSKAHLKWLADHQ